MVRVPAFATSGEGVALNGPVLGFLKRIAPPPAADPKAFEVKTQPRSLQLQYPRTRLKFLSFEVGAYDIGGRIDSLW